MRNCKSRVRLLSVWHQKPSQCDIITSYNLEKKFEWGRDLNLCLNLMSVSLCHRSLGVACVVFVLCVHLLVRFSFVSGPFYVNNIPLPDIYCVSR